MIARSQRVGWFSLLAGLVNRAREGASSRRELERLSPEERGEIARELNVSESELGRAARWPVSPELLSQRIEHAGLSEQELAASHGDVLRDLQRVCSLCSEKSRCASDLDQGRRASPAKYCPNELTFRALTSKPVSSADKTADADRPVASVRGTIPLPRHPGKAAT